jgi:hypothetical protein
MGEFKREFKQMCDNYDIKKTSSFWSLALFAGLIFVFDVFRLPKIKAKAFLGIALASK